MKTSNKILLLALAITVLSVLIFLIIARSNVTEGIPRSETSDITNIEVMASHDFNKFDLGYNNDYFLDETYEGLSVSGPKSAVDAIRFSDEEPMRVYYEGANRLSNKKLKIRIGIKNKTGLDITVEDNAKCNTNAQSLSIANIYADGNSSLELNVRSKNLIVFVGGNARVYSKVEEASVSATADGNGRINFSDGTLIDNLNLTISGNGKISGGEANHISGTISGNGKLTIDQVNHQGRVSLTGNGRDDSNYQE